MRGFDSDIHDCSPSVEGMFFAVRLKGASVIATDIDDALLGTLARELDITTSAPGCHECSGHPFDAKDKGCEGPCGCSMCSHVRPFQGNLAQRHH